MLAVSVMTLVVISKVSFRASIDPTAGSFSLPRASAVRLLSNEVPSGNQYPDSPSLPLGSVSIKRNRDIRKTAGRILLSSQRRKLAENDGQTNEVEQHEDIGSGDVGKSNSDEKSIESIGGNEGSQHESGREDSTSKEEETGSHESLGGSRNEGEQGSEQSESNVQEKRSGEAWQREDNGDERQGEVNGKDKNNGEDSPSENNREDGQGENNGVDEQRDKNGEGRQEEINGEGGEGENNGAGEHVGNNVEGGQENINGENNSEVGLVENNGEGRNVENNGEGGQGENYGERRKENNPSEESSGKIVQEDKGELDVSQDDKQRENIEVEKSAQDVQGETSEDKAEQNGQAENILVDTSAQIEDDGSGRQEVNNGGSSQIESSGEEIEGGNNGDDGQVENKEKPDEGGSTGDSSGEEAPGINGQRANDEGTAQENGSGEENERTGQGEHLEEINVGEKNQNGGQEEKEEETTEENKQEQSQVEIGNGRVENSGHSANDEQKSAEQDSEAGEGQDGSSKVEKRSEESHLDGEAVVDTGGQREHAKEFIYVYDLGDQFTWKLLESSPRWISELYSVEKIVLEMLQRQNIGRTTDPEKATLFHVPFFGAYFSMLRLGQHDYNTCVMYSSHVFETIMARVKKLGPWFERSNGQDHFTVASFDHGRCSMLGFIQNAQVYGDMFFIQITGDRVVHSIVNEHANHVLKDNEGIMREPEVEIDTPCFVQKRDIIVPPVVSPVLEIVSPLKQRSIRVAFRFKGEQQEDHIHFKRFLRKEIFDTWAHKGEEGWNFGVQGHLETFQDFTNSIFCICPPGVSQWSGRQWRAIVAGCIPVTFFRQHTNPLEEELDYSKFTINIDPDNVQSLKDRIEEVFNTPGRLEEMQNALAAVQEIFSWNEGLQDGFRVQLLKLLSKRACEIGSKTEGMCA